MLLDRQGHVVLTDFGLCKEGIKLKDVQPPPSAAHQNILRLKVIQKKPYDRTVDWWCLARSL